MIFFGYFRAGHIKISIAINIEDFEFDNIAQGIRTHTTGNMRKVPSTVINQHALPRGGCDIDIPIPVKVGRLNGKGVWLGAGNNCSNTESKPGASPVFTQV